MILYETFEVRSSIGAWGSPSKYFPTLKAAVEAAGVLMKEIESIKVGWFYKSLTTEGFVTITHLPSRKVKGQWELIDQRLWLELGADPEEEQ